MAEEGAGANPAGEGTLLRVRSHAAGRGAWMSFAEFYRDRRGQEPFPWMLRLAERFAAADFPDVLALPTGSAKTEIVVIWAWARLQNETLPRRLWMVSDRRVIVDQTVDVARALSN